MHRVNRGFSLIEIMVGMVVGLLTVMVIMQVFSVSESQKRTTTSGSDAQMNATYTMYALERELRVAGHGLTDGEGIGCNTLAYDSTALPPGPNTIRIAPVLITDGGGNNPDTISLMFGTASVTTSYDFVALSAGSNNITMTTNSGINIGDIVQIVETGSPPPVNCTLAQVTDKPASGFIARDAGNAVGPCPVPGSPTTACTGSRYNKAGGLGQDYSASAHVFNLGRLVTNTYRIDPATLNLVEDSAVTGAVAQTGSIIAHRVINLQAQYGVDDGSNGGVANDNIIDGWVNATGAWNTDNVAQTPSAAQLKQIKAIRIAMAIQSNQNEYDKQTQTCHATTAAPVVTWPTGPSMTLDLSSDPNWQCYRYKIYESVIPFKNLIWSAS